MRIRYPQIHAALLDEEDDQHILIPEEWRELAQLHDLLRVIRGNKIKMSEKDRERF